ncbi:MAG: 16S rRNA processing protein RimM [Clostridia bacterium]|nr:16S rRNA processing protein RimM [Clostridia bacterium]
MEQFAIGKVLKPQGIRGELKVQPYTDTAQDLSYYKEIFLDGTAYKVLSFRTGDGVAYLGLRGVPDRNAAELLRGKEITVPFEERKPLPEGRFYVAELLGCTVIDSEGAVIGVLTDVTQSATEYYTVQSGEKSILFPVPDGVILSVDVAARKIVVDKKRFAEVAVL